MFNKKDDTYQVIRAKAVEQWLEAMTIHEDLEVRGGVRATVGYIEELKRQIKDLEDKHVLKDVYLKKMKDQV